MVISGERGLQVDLINNHTRIDFSSYAKAFRSQLNQLSADMDTPFCFRFQNFCIDDFKTLSWGILTAIKTHNVSTLVTGNELK